MANYDLVLLDADGTLFDFAKAQETALRQTLHELNCQFDHVVLQQYEEINQHLWEALEKGQITKDSLGKMRFQQLFSWLGTVQDAEKANKMYLNNLGEADFLLEGAQSLCKSLSAHCTLAIATNGMAAAQYRRIEKSAIAPYIKHIFVSEEVGVAKPDPLFFAYALEKCGVLDKPQVIMVGDSLSADIRGALNFGLDACWVNFTAQPLPKELAGATQVTCLEELVPIVLEEGGRHP